MLYIYGMQECPRCKELEKEIAYHRSRIEALELMNRELLMLVEELSSKLNLARKHNGGEGGHDGDKDERSCDENDEHGDDMSTANGGSDYLSKLKKKKPGKQFGKQKRKKRRGAKKGHKGHGRNKCEQIDNEVDLTLDVCPQCGGSLREHKKPEEHVKEDLVISKVATKYCVHRYECESCKSEVKPAYEEGFIGKMAQSLSTLMHYYQGIPFGKIKEMFGWFGLGISEGSLALWGKKFGEIFRPFWDSLKENLKKSPHINADETGWPVNGDNCWLWLFNSPLGVFFTINESRGSKVLEEVLGESYDGVLISDFYGAYNRLDSVKQKCLVHLLREVREWSESDIFEKRAYCHGVGMIFEKAMKLLQKKTELSPEAYAGKVSKFLKGFDEFLESNFADKDCRRLHKRLARHRDELWTFLEQDVPYHNNDAERALRRSVINRKVSCGNRSDLGARVQEVLLTAIHSAKMMGHNLLQLFLNPTRLSFDTS